ncbi:MAG: isochorismatase family protein [Candidatus Gastranaerophilales bacterium]|nr:isochorismatase family protein [Candidatus Gastranaerophilales bacterium]
MLNADNSLLFLIDVQDRLTGMLKNSEEIAKNNSILAGAAKTLSIPALVSEQYPKGLGTTVFEVRQYIEPENIIEKTSFSALAANEIKSKLETFNRKKIILTGIETHICVYQTARALLESGYEVFVVKNACSSRKTKDYRTALELMRDYGARLTCVETVLFEWLGSSAHPNFKEIQALIK